MNAWRKLQRGPVVPQIEALLGERLQAGGWAVGEKVPSEAALAGELGVGRSSIREAVRLLSREGLLEVRHGAGTFVLDRTPTSLSASSWESAERLLRRAHLLEVYEVRRSLEVEAARLAAHRVPAEELPRLRALLHERSASAYDPTRFVTVDLDFHEAIVRLAGNAILTELYMVARPIIEKALVERIAHDGPLLDVDQAHDDLVAALEVHDEAAAIAATVANLDNTMEHLRDVTAN